MSSTLMSEGIERFILIGENVLNFHASDDCYYEEWFDEVTDADGWIALLNFRQHVVAGWSPPTSTSTSCSAGSSRKWGGEPSARRNSTAASTTASCTASARSADGVTGPDQRTATDIA